MRITAAPGGHPKGMAAVAIDGTTYRVNRYGVVFAPNQPDFPLGPCWETVHFAERDVADTVRDLIRPAYLRTEHRGGWAERVFHIVRARRAIDAAVAAQTDLTPAV